MILWHFPSKYRDNLIVTANIPSQSIKHSQAQVSTAQFELLQDVFMTLQYLIHCSVKCFGAPSVREQLYKNNFHFYILHSFPCNFIEFAANFCPSHSQKSTGLLISAWWGQLVVPKDEQSFPVAGVHTPLSINADTADVITHPWEGQLQLLNRCSLHRILWAAKHPGTRRRQSVQRAHDLGCPRLHAPLQVFPRRL